MTYHQTSVPFDTWDLPALLAIPDTLRPAHVELEVAEYGRFDNVVAAAREGLTGLRGKISAATEGAAAAAVLNELTRLDHLAEAGQQQSTQAGQALRDHAGQVASAGSDLGWVKSLAVPVKAALGAAAAPAGHLVDEGAHWFAADYANRYQATSNMNYTSTYPAHEPPGVSPTQAAAVAGGGGGGLGITPGGAAIPEIGQAGAPPRGVPGPDGGLGAVPGSGGGGPGPGIGAGVTPGGGPGPGLGPGRGGAPGPGSGVPSPRPAPQPGRPLPGPAHPTPLPARSLPGGGVGTGRPGGSATGRTPGPSLPDSRPDAGTGRGGWGGGPGSGNGVGSGGNGAGSGGNGAGGGTVHGLGGGRPPAGAPAVAAPTNPGSGNGGAGGSRSGAIGGVPMGAGASGARSDEVHQRPPWLLQDDPNSIWFAGLPEYCDPVIGGEPHPDQHR